MAKAGENRHGIAILPACACRPPGDAGLAKWLSRGTVAYAEPQTEMLLTVLARLGESVPAGSLAAIRFWGQTGERSSAWIAAADPIHLEARLHSLRVRSLRPDELPKSDLRPLFDHLKATLGSDAGLAFEHIGRHGYLRGNGSIATAAMSASILHGLPPDEFMPSGESASGYHRLLGEIQMALHEHDVNVKRAEAGQSPINSLWLWGGGIAPEPGKRPLPALYANDALFRGYWLSCGGVVTDWDAVSEHSTSGTFVAVLPDCASAESLRLCDDYLERLRLSLKRGTVGSLTLLFRDGLSVEISRWDAARFWRGVSPLLRKAGDSD